MIDLTGEMFGRGKIDTVSFGERLRAIRKQLNLSLEKFGEEIGLSKGQTWEWEQGRHWPSSAFLRKLPVAYRINLNWLLTGEGPRFLDEQQEEAVRLAEQILQLPPEDRKMVRDFIEAHLEDR